MSDKVYVGRRCASVSKPSALDPISKIILWIDSENCFEAGDDSGREFEITCPYGTQQMAEDLLQKLGGYVYRPMQAGDALLDPAAELGDAVTVDGCYTKLASMELSFDSLMTSDISAPGASELPQEYSFSSAEKILNRKIARNRSLISKTAEQIRLEVFGEDGYTGSSITAQIDDIELSVKGALGTDEEGNLMPVTSSIEAALGEISLSVKNGETSSSIVLKVGENELSGSIEMTGLVTFKGLKEGKTTIDGGWIKTDSLLVDALHLSGLLTIYSGEYTLGDWVYDENLGDFVQQRIETVGGYIGYDSGFSGGKGIGIRSYEGQSQMVCTDVAVRISYGDEFGITQVVCMPTALTLEGLSLIQMYINGAARMNFDDRGITPIGERLSLGDPSYEWYDVYAAGTSMSDLLSRVEALESA